MRQQYRGNATLQLNAIYWMVALALLAGVSSCQKLADIPSLLLPSAEQSHPRVIDSSPRPDQNSVPENTSIFLEFDRAMDRRSVQDSFSLTGTSAVSGDFRWIGKRMIFETESPLSTGASYELTLRKNATDEDGKSLATPYLLSFFAGPRVDGPQVLTMEPAPNAQKAPADSHILLRFSRAMASETTENAFRLSPRVPGGITWSEDRKEMSYRPIQPLEIGQIYSVQIGAEATDQDGVPIMSAFNASFQVGQDFQSPSVLQVMESGNPEPLTDGQSGVARDSRYRIRFDEPMNYSAVQAAFSLSPTSRNVSLDGRYSWNSDFTELTFSPSRTLEPESEYRLRLGEGASDKAGNRLQEPFYLHFTVDGSAGLINSEYLQLEEARKVYPPAEMSLVANGSRLNSMSLPRPYAGSWNAVLEFEFSHNVKPGSVLPENLTISKISGPYPSSVYFESVQFLGSDEKESNVVRLEVAGLHPNLYRITLYGSRSGLRSAATSQESTWMEKTRTVYFIPEPD
ncbi:MAG: hypothetical protein CMN76_13185 [Spirochaetaceae bacterium]|nr:hypothetical protein [Spirochaetaceae bacterium]|tara:strand:+ start:49121 stop:50662 length:1542 start_codon:yes stop_codon:yes gene_type:complete